MIITQLTGGLGNQMFQYALGKVLTVKNRDDLYLDRSVFYDAKNSNTKRPYELDIFGINNPECSIPDRIRLGDENPILKFINRVLNTHFNVNPPSLIKETAHSFQSEILERTGDLYLRGFWQNEKYFADYRGLILKTFTFRKKISKKSADLLRLIASSNSVAVHVRRGDYISNPSAKKYHGVCSPSYYQTAATMLAKKVSSPTFYVFSDDSKWCLANLKLSGKTVFVTHNTGINNWEDMRLMSACSHHIIANSSFSWWGAWLCQNPDKVVIAPKQWLADSKTKMEDIVPLNWIRL